MKIKICGMRDQENVRQIIELLPEYIGFIFYPPSKRYVGKEISSRILNQIPSGIKKVGVFVNEKAGNLLKIAKQNSLDMIQLHGGEKPGYCSEIRDFYPVIKVFSIDKGFDINNSKEYLEVSDYFLFDTKTVLKGGSGNKFDWSMLGDYHENKPFFLSGGIDLHDAEKIKNHNFINLHGLDINSRFELSPGLKDAEKIKSFMKLIR